MEKVYTDIQQLPLLLNAKEVATVLRISRANAYALMHSDLVHCIHIGKRMLLPKTELLYLLEAGKIVEESA